MAYMYAISAGNPMHSYMLAPCEECRTVGPCEHYLSRKEINGVNACNRCDGDPRTCGHFNDNRDYDGPFDASNKPNWMSWELWNEAAQWCAEHIDEVHWTLKGSGEYPDGSHGAIPYLRNMVEG